MSARTCIGFVVAAAAIFACVATDRLARGGDASPPAGAVAKPAVDYGPIKSIAIQFQEQPADKLSLRGRDARHQVLVMGTYGNGQVRDLTSEAKYSLAREGIVTASPTGLLTPVGDGSTSLTAKAGDGSVTATLAVTVENVGVDAPINFQNQVVPIFTRYGCNGGGCHGKSGGQNGFRLSLLGFEPTEDYEYLTRETRGRRVFPAAPDRSLLLLKATGILPHGGGKRIDAASDDYRVIARWIGQGMPYGSPSDPTLDRIEVIPGKRTMARSDAQQLLVVARYSDGSTVDVTRSALFEPNDQEMARAEEGGRISIAERPGDVAVMVRYQGKVGVFRATIPLGSTVVDAQLPPVRNYIDELVFKKLKEIGMPPSAASSDSTFLRRVTIDIAGRLPTAEEAQKFLADTDPAKRDKWIDQLLNSSEYADYFANKWSALLRNKRSDASYARGTYEFYDWIRDSLLTNKPYDQFVREIITASGEIRSNPPVAWYRQVKTPGAQLEDTAQLFMGMRLQCAQCHHHPFEKWSQQDYYGLSAFFSRVGTKPSPEPGGQVVFSRRGVASANNPKTKQDVKPHGLDDPTAADIPADEDPRVALAQWLTRPENPFFSKSLVNRYWKHFFGRGLVDPEDDMRETNPPTNPELLNALAKHFAESGYNLKDLVRTICQSRVYQLDSIPNEQNGIDRQNFSRYYPRRLTAEVMLDAVNTVSASENKFDGLPVGTKAVQLPDNFFNTQSYFLTVFGRPEGSSSCECERSQEPNLAQSLHLLNAKDLQEKIGRGDGRAAKLAREKERSDDQKVRDLYLIAFSREPSTSEMATAKGYVEKVVARADDKDGKDEASRRQRAYEDLMWALINTKEFGFNH